MARIRRQANEVDEWQRGDRLQPRRRNARLDPSPRGIGDLNRCSAGAQLREPLVVHR